MKNLLKLKLRKYGRMVHLNHKRETRTEDEIDNFIMGMTNQSRSLSER